MLGSDPMVTDSHSLGSLPEMRGMDDENGGGQEGDEVQHNPEDDQHESCIAVACRTLSSLYQFVPSDCVNGHATNSNQSRSMLKPPTPEVSPVNDIVFCTTRFATETVSRLLNCTARSCAGDPSILLVLGSILLRILTWYEALYQSEIGELGLSATPSPSGREDVGLDGSHSSVTHSIELSQPSESMEESIYTVPLTIPLTIGTFNLSLATETKMKAQLLLCEVQTLSQVCQALGRRVQAAESIRGEKDLCGQSNTHLLRKLGELRHALTASFQRHIMKVHQADKSPNTTGRSTDATRFGNTLLFSPIIAGTLFGDAGRDIGARRRTALVKGVLTIILIGDRALPV
ncbi:unnamed protein product [Penicillium palitans]